MDSRPDSNATSKNFLGFGIQIPLHGATWFVQVKKLYTIQTSSHSSAILTLENSPTGVNAGIIKFHAESNLQTDAEDVTSKSCNSLSPKSRIVQHSASFQCYTRSFAKFRNHFMPLLNTKNKKTRRRGAGWFMMVKLLQLSHLHKGL